MNEILFYAVIFISNVIQGITGFAGTVIAMPFSIRLMGLDTASAVLNVLGLLAGLYVLLGNHRHVKWKELKRILVFMGPSLLFGIAFKRILSFDPRILYVTLGVIVTLFGLYSLFRLLYDEKRGEKARDAKSPSEEGPLSALNVITLIASGIVHGMYVCGGPLLVSYLTRRVPEQKQFRATVSVVWIVLNGMILISQLFQGVWTGEIFRIQLIAVPVLALAMFVGSLIFKRMNRRFFLILSYVLLIIAGASLFFK
ncbi:MAG: sulfite exporter TauE/SafE family protein [Lachnospiraceae bacterium]|nr:sulfite exporter TauE/SafE family protein [Lachnospiraceae bacterium]